MYKVPTENYKILIREIKGYIKRVWYLSCSWITRLQNICFLQLEPQLQSQKTCSI